MTTSYPVLDRMVSLWDLPHEQRGPRHRKDGFVRNGRLAVVDVVASLREDYAQEKIEDQLSRFLAEMAVLHRAGDRPRGDVLPVFQCALTLAWADDGIRIGPALARELVGALPSMYVGPDVRRIIARYLTAEDVLEVLLAELRREDSPRVLRASALSGLRAYRESLRGLSGERAARLKREMRVALERLMSGDDDDGRKRARHALTALDRLG